MTRRRPSIAMGRRCLGWSAVGIAMMMMMTTPGVWAQNLNQQCKTTADCPEGTACTAGVDALQAIQTCVKYPSCGGDMAGNCPVAMDDQLTCSFVPDTSCKNGAKCISYDGVSGVFKCLTLASCNGFLGNNACSEACSSANGKACNGRGTCESTGSRTFRCRCNDGWQGDRCETVANATCTVGVGDCGRSGKCVDGKCKCEQGWKGAQCELPPQVAKKKPTSKQTRQSNGSDVVVDDSSSSSSEQGIGTIIAIILGIFAFAVAALVFIAKRSRRQRREEATASVFGEDAAGRFTDGPVTPKDTIATI